MKYLVIDMQTFSNGAMSTPTYAFDAMDSALQKYYTILASAVKSSLPMHACALMTNEGICLRSEHYAHEQPEPEPEEA